MIAFLLFWLHRAMLLGVGFTGLFLGIAVHRGDTGGAVLYGLLFVLFVTGLRLMSADKRPTA